MVREGVARARAEGVTLDGVALAVNVGDTLGVEASDGLGVRLGNVLVVGEGDTPGGNGRPLAVSATPPVLVGYGDGPALDGGAPVDHDGRLVVHGVALGGLGADRSAAGGTVVPCGRVPGAVNRPGARTVPGASGLARSDCSLGAGDATAVGASAAGGTAGRGTVPARAVAGCRPVTAGLTGGSRLAISVVGRGDGRREGGATDVTEVRTGRADRVTRGLCGPAAFTGTDDSTGVLVVVVAAWARWARSQYVAVLSVAMAAAAASDAHRRSLRSLCLAMAPTPENRRGPRHVRGV
ncbi:hypothetical protein GCM10009681_28750 [Luedemannella helvata]|uniref:Uncharacterized protein n=1 Tax=Luedemannella helvata TaxID=349315 RepID=A0ABP4WJ44_9ACTN